MTVKDPKSLVVVYSSPIGFDAEMVKAMLDDESIPCTVENTHDPFPGLTVMPCQVFVAAEYEVAARKLIDDHEQRRKHRVAQEENAKK